MTQEPRISFVFDRKKKASATTAAQVELRVYHERQRSYITTDVLLYDGQWLNDKVVNRFDAPRLNGQLAAQYASLNDYIYRYIEQNGDFTLSALDGYRDKNATLQLSSDTEDPFVWIMERLQKRVIKENTRMAHERTIKDLQRSGLFKKWSDFTPANIMKWDDRLKERLHRQTSVHCYHKRMKLYMHEAEIFGKVKQNPYNFVKIECGKTEGIKFITTAERTRIENLQLEAGEEKARDLFIFACYTGLSFCDMQKIKLEDVKRENGQYYIDDTRRKTGTKYHIVLLPKAMEILKKYKFNLNIITNQKANWYLKSVQALARVDTRLTMHVGRHTFATWALNEGIPIEVVSRMLAHSNIGITQVYAKVLPTKVDQAFAKLKAIS